MDIYIKDTNRETGKVSWKKVSLDDIRGDLELMIDWGGCVGDKIVIKDETIHGMPMRKLGDVKTVEAGQNAAQEQQANEQAAAAENPTEEKKTDGPTRMSWDEIMADPEYNKQMQAVVQSRLRSAKGAEETLGKLTPTLELLARQHNLDPANIDYDALAKAISDDNAYYEDKALEMGISVETAKRLDRLIAGAKMQMIGVT